MKISIISNNIVIDGNIKSLSEVREISALIDKLSNESRDIKIILENSLSFPSSLIGILIKNIKQNNLKISIVAKDSRVFDTLSDLGMLELFNVKKA